MKGAQQKQVGEPVSAASSNVVPMAQQGAVSVVIVGAGFAGIGMAIKLKQAGINDFVILERDQRVGGSWRDNQYPGAACDIPSNLYSYSFAQNPQWSRAFSGAPEILDYIDGMVEQFGLKASIRFNTNVQGMHFDEDAGLWTLPCEDGACWQARSVVMASGPLANCSLPDIRGIGDFKGKVIHSARWDHDYDFSGKKVAVIGTGASAVQIIPELVKQARHVTVFQRTPGWVLPRPDYRTPAWQRRLFERFPAAQTAVREALFYGHESMALGLIWDSPLTRALERFARWHLRRQVKDRWMRRQLTPDYRLGCKRVLMSSDYYPALQQPNCKLVTWPIDRIGEQGICTAEGIEHRFDCIVCATGFEVSHQGSPYPVTGVGGRSLADDWAGGAQAYKSVNISGYPNLFLTFGPNSGPGHNSALVYMESQLDYALQGIDRILRDNLRMLDVKPDVQKRYNADIQKRLARTNWNSGCKSWYLTPEGFNATMYPGFATQYANQLKGIEEKDYVMVPA